MAILLEDLETKAQHVDTAALDTILLSQKKALGRCNSVLNCSTCFLRPELSLLFGMVTERLASVYESTVARYLDSTNDGALRLEHTADEKHPSRGNLMDHVKVCLGCCEIEAPDERVAVVRLLIILQLQNLKNLSEAVAKVVASRGDGEPQVLKLRAAERKLAELTGRIRLSEL